MQFGKVDPQQIPLIDFSLPKDPGANHSVLGGVKSTSLDVKLGCSRWGQKGWIGNYYPEKTRQKDMLLAYAKQFDTVELSPTHYKIPTAAQVEKWRDETPESFRFSPKIFQGISHWDRLRNTAERTTDFCSAVMHFEKKLGPCFLQLPPNFNPTNGVQLFDYIADWLQEISLAVELRHQEWFSNSENSSRLFDALTQRNMATVITDTSGRRDLMHMRLTNKTAFVRFVGNGLHTNDYQRIDNWISRLLYWKEMGLKEVYFFVHQHDALDSPKLIEYMADALSQNSEITVKRPSFKEGESQSTLF